MKPAVLESWMYGDPANVVERLEAQSINRQRRAAAHEAELARCRREDARHDEKGLTPGTVLTMRRARIRELVQGVLKGKA